MLGRFIKGEIVHLPLVTTDATGIPTLPDQCPVAEIRLSAAVVENVFLTIKDRYQVTALFLTPVYLDEAYSAGIYSVSFSWIIGGTSYGAEEEFEVTAAGHQEGALLSFGTMELPAATYVMAGTRRGRVKKYRNPRML